jgi:hypothetical protein
MVDPFQYRFTEWLPGHASQLDEDDPGEGTLVEGVVEASAETVSTIDQFRELPVRNQRLVLGMAADMVLNANWLAHSSRTLGREHFWGLYMIGSRARGEARPDSDLDMLSVGNMSNFDLSLNFLRPYQEPEHRTPGTPFEGFMVTMPPDHELPDEYNVGEVDRKYWVRAQTQEEDAVGVDLGVVDLTHMRAGLGEFTATMDVEDGRPLPRVPLVELTVAARPMVWH